MANSLAQVLAEDQRLVVLRLLSEVAGAHLNEDVLRQGLASVGHQVGRTDVRAVVQFLERHALVQVEKLAMPSGELWLVQLTDDGSAVAGGRRHEGIARPTLR